MKIIIGSKNPSKIKAVESVFSKSEVLSLDVLSQVSVQPFSDDETMNGAINRAKQCASYDAIGIGLEGGVMYLEGKLFLCNWGALATTDNRIYLASGARIPLPKEINVQLKAGFELGDLMDIYSEKQGVRNKEGAIGIFTNELVTRHEMFTHIVQLLYGQWEYDTNKL